MSPNPEEDFWSDPADAFWLYGPQGRVLLVLDRNGGRNGGPNNPH